MHSPILLLKRGLPVINCALRKVRKQVAWSHAIEQRIFAKAFHIWGIYLWISYRGITIALIVGKV